MRVTVRHRAKHRRSVLKARSLGALGEQKIPLVGQHVGSTSVFRRRFELALQGCHELLRFVADLRSPPAAKIYGKAPPLVHMAMLVGIARIDARARALFRHPSYLERVPVTHGLARP
jgi:hypothetical protein